MVDTLKHIALEEGCIFEHTDNAREALEKIDDLVKPTVLVTCWSDAGICEQAEHHPNSDLFKTVFGIAWDKIAEYRDGYAQIPVGPACNTEKCRESDKYSAKMDRYTCCTFPAAPLNLKAWYSSNLNVNNPLMKWCPFGLNNEGHGTSILPNYRGRPKKGLVYANFQDNTLERIQLKQWLQTQSWVTFRSSAGLKVEDYLAEMSEHKFCLSPPGNGLDCYRNYEALYLGTVPILLDSIFSRHIMASEIPILACQSYYSLNHKILDSAWGKAQEGEEFFECEKLKKSYWQQEFRNAVAAMYNK